MDDKIRTDVSIFSGGTGASVTPETCITIKKRNMKSYAVSPLKNDPIPNQ